MTANLLSMLQGLTAPDREVDALIENATGTASFRRKPDTLIGDSDYVRCDVKPLTASLDATVALCERVLPGYDWTVDKSGGRGFAGVGQSFNEEAATPAIALLIAILTALEARDAE